MSSDQKGIWVYADLDCTIVIECRNCGDSRRLDSAVKADSLVAALSLFSAHHSYCPPKSEKEH